MVNFLLHQSKQHKILYRLVYLSKERGGARFQELDRMGVKLGLAPWSPQVKGLGPLARFNFEMHKVIQIRTLPHRVQYEISARQNLTIILSELNHGFDLRTCIRIEKLVLNAKTLMFQISSTSFS